MPTRLGFDAISAGGTLAWLMDFLDDGLITPAALGVDRVPKWEMANFDVVGDSMHNAELGMALLVQMTQPGGNIPLQFGARKFARRLAREKGSPVLDRFVYNAFARQGWMVPNQYWTPGAYAPMAITGKYYMHYGRDFLPPRELGRESARRMLKELMLDNLGICRFNRTWAETLIPDIVENIFGCGEAFLRSISLTASRITSRNASVFWESMRARDMVSTFLKNKKKDFISAWGSRSGDHDPMALDTAGLLGIEPKAFAVPVIKGSAETDHPRQIRTLLGTRKGGHEQRPAQRRPVRIP